MIAAEVEIRTLRDDERDPLLELLDGWELDDGWRGRDFFRRYLDDDPAFRPDNVWVAVREGELCSCAQIFPRRMRIRGRELSLCGIGSVFTAPGERGAGLARDVLAAALAAAADRGFDLAALFAERLSWYRSQGWVVVPRELATLRLASPARAPTCCRQLDAARDLAQLARLHDDFDRDADGPLVRTVPDWATSLALAGNPDELFLVAPRSGPLGAYVRATVLGGEPTVTEWAHAPGGASLLAAAVVDLLEAASERWADGPVATAAAPAPSPELRAALQAVGVQHTPRADTSFMLRSLCAKSLTQRCGTDDENRLLRADRVCFWTSDRF